MRTIKAGNLFTFSENRLQQKLKRGDISGYSVLDIIEGAYKVRKYLDKHKFLKVPALTKEEKIRMHRAAVSRYQELHQDKYSLSQKKYRSKHKR
jgi:hypothetical protein